MVTVSYSELKEAVDEIERLERREEELEDRDELWVERFRSFQEARAFVEDWALQMGMIPDSLVSDLKELKRSTFDEAMVGLAAIADRDRALAEIEGEDE